MKFLFFFMGMFFSLNAQISHDQKLFLQANELYSMGKIEEAYNLYKHIKPINQATLFNEGMCAYKLKQYGKALACWRKAERYWSIFNRFDLVRNILKAKNRGVLDEQGKSVSPHIFLQALCLSLIISIPTIHLQLLVLLLWAFLFVFLRRLYRKKQTFLIFIAFLLLCLSASTLAFKYSLARKRMIVTTLNDVPVFSGPGRNFALLGHLPDAVETAILKESGEFCKIRTSSVTGWIETRNIEEITCQTDAQ
jgi:ABC-type glycerol-3-phosphate transport system permease component